MDNVISKNRRLTQLDPEEGAAVLIDKPIDWTSFDVVNKIRYAIRYHLGVKKYKVGHAGTLDPRAGGLLIICFGKYTKRIEELMNADKSYEAVITLGVDTPSYDSESLPHIYYPYKKVSTADVQNIIEHFTGEQQQLPPMFSAVKIKGLPLYKLARKGKEIKREARTIHISKLEISILGDRHLGLSIDCSKGTYIRSLAYDIGKYLGTGAYLLSLRRTRIGKFTVENAIDINAFIDQLNHLKQMVG